MAYTLAMKVLINENIPVGTVHQSEIVGNGDIMHIYMNPQDFDRLIELINKEIIKKDELKELSDASLEAADSWAKENP